MYRLILVFALIFCFDAEASLPEPIDAMITERECQVSTNCVTWTNLKDLDQLHINSKIAYWGLKDKVALSNIEIKSTWQTFTVEKGFLMLEGKLYPAKSVFGNPDPDWFYINQIGIAGNVRGSTISGINSVGTSIEQAHTSVPRFDFAEHMLGTIKGGQIDGLKNIYADNGVIRSGNLEYGTLLYRGILYHAPGYFEQGKFHKGTNP